jgi:membrane protein YqaA with SNARE-associated domain
MTGAASPAPDPSGSLTGNLVTDLAILFTVSFNGPILFWLPASTELLATAMGRMNPSVSPSLVGIACASGQCTLFALLFAFGGRIASKWPWLRKRVDAVAAHRHALLNRGKLFLAVGAGVAGFPPTVPLFTLAPSLQMRLPPMLFVVFLARYVRFAGCCLLGSWSRQPGGATSWAVATFGSLSSRWAAAATSYAAAPLNGTLGAALGDGSTGLRARLVAPD